MSNRRAGVTLVELLIVIALIVLLAGLSVAVSQSGLFESHKVVSAADRTSGWLLIAKQRAKRDNLPRGVRFLLTPVRNPELSPSPQNLAYFASTEAQYIESPEPWVPNPNPGDPTPTPTGPTGPKGPRIAFVYHYEAPTNIFHNNSTYMHCHFTTDPTRTVVDMAEFVQRVNVGDSLLLPGLGRICRIEAITDSTVNIGGVPHPSKELKFADFGYPDLGANNSGPQGSPPNACRLVYEFGFQPAARPLIGEPALQLTSGAVIDVRMSTVPLVLHPLAPTTNGVAPQVTTDPTTGEPFYHFDVMFSPSGGLVYAPQSLVCLWVRDPIRTPNPRWDYALGAAGQDARSAYDAAGEQSLVTVYSATGNIATHPPAYAGPPPQGTGGDPYRYAKDGINSGI